ncbi:Dyp-type peroxidase [Spirosoma rhododendri]|uniref:Peroxidase n=1 Tax=Spirosoma rhododendri TaxID=2728024 RepID=A0A7L5DM29_9BACT|nr:peroxidase [Spirosoma rhododendri]QJD77498.1 peroxidase [Spirosoma rhododendri]
MSLDLTKSGISQTDPGYLAIANDLQGNILTSHGRNFTGQLLVRFNPAKRADVRAYLKKLAITERITSAKQQRADADLFNKQKKAGKVPTQVFFRGVYLTAKGYEALGFTNLHQFDSQFQAGMQASQADLHDPLVNDWEGGYQNEGDALFLFAHGVEPTLRAKVAEFAAFLRDQKLAKVLAVEYGKGFTNEVGDHLEHFGYVDGVSQPVFFTQDTPPDRTNWNPVAPLKLVLVPDPMGTPGQSFGSYYVFRKLEQNVRGFKEMEKSLADALGLEDDDAERAGAMVVGRFENGMPVTMSATDKKVTLKDNQIGKINDFNYGQLIDGHDDLKGGRCPFQGHIRKTNPRGTGDGESPADERMHLMARRGITYGDRLIEPKDEPDFDEMPTEGVGLLFASFQSSIGEQFEFTQKNWANLSSFPFSSPDITGIDPVIGQPAPGEAVSHCFPTVWNDGSPGNMKQFDGFAGFVTMKGGDYFFAPSLTFFKNL